MKHMKITLLSFLISFQALQAQELTIIPAGKSLHRDAPVAAYTFDMSLLNDLNKSASSLSFEELKEFWRNFLNTTPFQNDIQFPEGYTDARFNYHHIGIRIDGQLNLNLIRAMVTVQREDLEILFRITPKAFVGSDYNEVKDNAERVYKCMNLTNFRSESSSECQNIHQLTQLSRPQFEDLKSLYSRVARASLLHFTHEYCEIQFDEYLPNQHQMIRDILSLRDKYMTDAISKGRWGRHEALKKEFSLPPTGVQIAGPSLTVCRGTNNLSLEWHSNSK